MIIKTAIERIFVLTEDEKLSIDLVAILNNHGISSYASNNIIESFNLLNHNRQQAIIVDASITNICVLDIIEKIKINNPDNIIILLLDKDTKQKRMYKNYGIHNFLKKP